MKTLFIARQDNLFQQFANPQFKISEDYRIIDQVLSDEQIIMELAKDFPDSLTGRNRTPVEQTLRFLVLKHQRNLSYRELERMLQVNLEDRWFCKISDQTPCFKTIQNQLSAIKQETIIAINDKVMTEARKRKLTKGKRMRVDSTVTEANIHYPTDISLIADGIRVINRVVKRFKIIPKGYRTFTRKIKQQLNRYRSFGRKNKEIRKAIIQKIVEMGKTIIKKTKHFRKKDIQWPRKILSKIVQQTEDRLAEKKIDNRIVSVFEPTARPILKGKQGKPCEFGQEVQVQEDEHFITNWQINNKGSDSKFFPQAIQKHKELYGKPPEEIATDRNYYSAVNKEFAEKQGVKHVCIPKKGKLNETEKEFQATPKFKKMQRWRAGGEAKISLLKRKYKLDKCRYKGDNGMAVWVGGGILACNLITIAKLIIS